MIYKLKMVFVSSVLLMLVGCVSPIPLAEQTPSPDYLPPNKILLTVNDQRTRVFDGKPDDFVGVAHGSFGIPFDWHVGTVLATEDGDKERNLAEFLEHRISTGLNSKGWDTEVVAIADPMDEGSITQTIQEKDAQKLLMINIHEWYFSINLNWVSAFNFDTDATVNIYETEDGKLFQKRIAGRDVIEEKADESPQNNILRAYRAQLVEIFSDPEVKDALLKM
ncbi:hypothetical protein ACFSJ3_14940 [Corallincola platygyrae]|uniref:Lipoprotein n=1 Tax=Corallincola platygyrae TaxID=1193278 RepID=A0ABW4XNY4_9GAMM